MDEINTKSRAAKRLRIYWGAQTAGQRSTGFWRLGLNYSPESQYGLRSDDMQVPCGLWRVGLGLAPAPTVGWKQSEATSISCIEALLELGKAARRFMLRTPLVQALFAILP